MESGPDSRFDGLDRVCDGRVGCRTVQVPTLTGGQGIRRIDGQVKFRLEAGRQRHSRADRNRMGGTAKVTPREIPIPDSRAAGLQRIDRNRVGRAEREPEGRGTCLRWAAIEREVQPFRIGLHQKRTFGLERRGDIDRRGRRDPVRSRPGITPRGEHETRIGGDELRGRSFEPMGRPLVPPQTRRSPIGDIVDEDSGSGWRSREPC